VIQVESVGINNDYVVIYVLNMFWFIYC